VKKTLLLFLCLLLLAAPAVVQAQFDYSTNSDGTLTVTGYTGSGGAVTIPTNINGLTVTGIGSDMLVFNSEVTSLCIPGSITNISANAVFSCRGLRSVFVGNGITDISSYMLASCVNLTNVTLPESVTNIGDGAFESDGLISVAIPNSVVNIGSIYPRISKST
jgi:hypothetical protein